MFVQVVTVGVPFGFAATDNPCINNPLQVVDVVFTGRLLVWLCVGKITVTFTSRTLNEARQKEARGPNCRFSHGNCLKDAHVNIRKIVCPFFIKSVLFLWISEEQNSHEASANKHSTSG